MARTSMSALIARVRSLINDTTSPQIFTDDQIEQVMDEGRVDVVNQALIPKETYSGSTLQYVNYYSAVGGWENDYALTQFLTDPVTPSSVEPIAGHFTFSASVYPPVYITGKIHDVYRAAADLLDRQSAKVAQKFDVTVGGQTFRRAQAFEALQKLAKSYRMRQRPKSIGMVRSDLNTGRDVGLGPRPIDYVPNGKA